MRVGREAEQAKKTRSDSSICSSIHHSRSKSLIGRSLVQFENQVDPETPSPDRVRILHPCKLCKGLVLFHLGGRCSVHLCRLKASSIAFDGTLGVGSSRRTNGCDHAQSEHFQFEDAVVGHRICRVVSPMLQLYAHFPYLVLRCGSNGTITACSPSRSNPFRVANSTRARQAAPTSSVSRL